MPRAIFLDRDNTLIRNDGDLGDPEKVVLMPGAAEAVAALGRIGYRIVVVSNQGGVARGKYSEENVDRIHHRVAEVIRREAGGVIERFYYCPYHPQGTVEKYRCEHPWRKPQPGMILQAAADMGLHLSQCWTIGDQPRDVQAGRAAGTRTILLSETAHSGDADYIAPSLAQAVRIICDLTPDT